MLKSELDESVIEESTFANFFLNDYLISIYTSSLSIKKSSFINNEVDRSLGGIIYFQNERFDISKSYFSHCKAANGVVFLYASSHGYPKIALFNETLVEYIESTSGAVNLGSKEEFTFEENNFSACFSDSRNTFILFDVCCDMSARYLNLEGAYTISPLIEVYHDESYTSTNYLMTILEANIYNNHRQSSLFYTMFRGVLRLKVQQCHFVNNDPCYFYTTSSSSDLIAEIVQTNFDISKEEALLNYFNQGTEGIIFGNDTTYPFKKREYGLICNRREENNNNYIMLKAVITISCFLYE